MKEFVSYTLLRLALLVGTFAIVAGIWILVAGSLSWFWTALIAFVISGIASYFLLNGQRVAFASRVETRADAAIERMRAREDAE